MSVRRWSNGLDAVKSRVRNEKLLNLRLELCFKLSQRDCLVVERAKDPPTIELRYAIGFVLISKGEYSYRRF